jgi:hypothetical protein
MSRNTKRALAAIAAAATIYTGFGTVQASAAGPCHPHPEVCEAEAMSGTDHMPTGQATHGPCSLGPLSWVCAVGLDRVVR